MSGAGNLSLSGNLDPLSLHSSCHLASPCFQLPPRHGGLLHSGRAPGGGDCQVLSLLPHLSMITVTNIVQNNHRVTGQTVCCRELLCGVHVHGRDLPHCHQVRPGCTDLLHCSVLQTDGHWFLLDGC